MTKMRKFLAMFLSLLTICLQGTEAFAQMHHGNIYKVHNTCENTLQFKSNIGTQTYSAQPTDICIKMDGLVVDFTTKKPVIINGRLYVPKDEFFSIADKYFQIRNITVDKSLISTINVDNVDYFAIADIKCVPNFKVHWNEQKRKINVVTLSDAELKEVEEGYNYYVKVNKTQSELFNNLDEVGNIIYNYYVTNTKPTSSERDSLKKIKNCDALVNEMINNIKLKKTHEILGDLRNSTIAGFEDVMKLTNIINKFANDEITAEEFVVESNKIAKEDIFVDGAYVGKNTTRAKDILNIE